MAAFSSNGRGTTAKKKPLQGGGYFSKRQAEFKPFLWPEVDGDLMRMCADALLWHGYGIAFFQATGGRGVKVRLYTDGPPSDAIVLTAGELNGLLQWIVDDLKAGDDQVKAIFEEVSTWLESRDR